MGKLSNAIKAALCCVRNTTTDADIPTPALKRKDYSGKTRAGVSVELAEPGPQFLGKRTYTENLGTTSFFSVKPPPIVISPVDAYPERDTQPGISADEFAQELSIKVGMRPRSGTYEAKLPHRIETQISEPEDIELHVAN